MFRKISNLGVESNKGFVVDPLDRYTYNYSEKQGEIDIQVEWGIGEDRDMVYVYDYELRWSKYY